jgi:hypothetical protein
MNSTTLCVDMAHTHGYYGETMAFKELDQIGLAFVHDDGLDVNPQPMSYELTPYRKEACMLYLAVF